jgi:membrane protein DedA with SNARE-associated domain
MTGNRPSRARLAALGAVLALALMAAVAQAQPAAEASKSRVAALIADVEPILERWGYPAIAGAAALDLAGIPVPAVGIMVAATVAADRQELRLDLVALLALAGAVAGSQLGYAIGRVGGRPLLARLPVSPARIAKLERSYGRWGSLIVAAAPFLDGLRQLNGITAGLLQFPWWRFTLASTLGSAVLVAFWVGGTWLVDEHLAMILPLVRAGKPWLIAVAALGLVALLFHLRRRRAERAAAGEAG